MFLNKTVTGLAVLAFTVGPGSIGILGQEFHPVRTSAQLFRPEVAGAVAKLSLTYRSKCFWPTDEEVREKGVPLDAVPPDVLDEAEKRVSQILRPKWVPQGLKPHLIPVRIHMPYIPPQDVDYLIVRYEIRGHRFQIREDGQSMGVLIVPPQALEPQATMQDYLLQMAKRFLNLPEERIRSIQFDLRVQSVDAGGSVHYGKMDCADKREDVRRVWWHKIFLWSDGQVVHFSCILRKEDDSVVHQPDFGIPPRFQPRANAVPREHGRARDDEAVVPGKEEKPSRETPQEAFPPPNPHGLSPRTLEAKLVLPVAADILQQRFFFTFRAMECSQAEREGLFGHRKAQFEAFHLQDLLPICEWPGAHSLSRFYYELDLPSTGNSQTQEGKLKFQVDVKRKPGIVPDSVVTDYFLAFTWPVRVVEVPRKPGSNRPPKTELRVIPARDIEQHKDRLWDPEQFLNTVPQEDRRAIEGVFEQYASGPEGYLKSHSKRFEWPGLEGIRAREHGGHWGMLEFRVEQGLGWLPRIANAREPAGFPKSAGQRPGRPEAGPWLRLTPKRIEPLGPDKVRVVAEYVSREYTVSVGEQPELVSRCDPDSEWILVKEEGEWKVLTYMLEWWRPPDGQVTGDR
ncbi:MAG: hypothetical protein FJ279_07515 [Planctomycetes bacterium]|nr:hypothetical protein [Planctomycetota bacterium]